MCLTLVIELLYKEYILDGAVTFLKQYAKELQLKCQTVKVSTFFLSALLVFHLYNKSKRLVKISLKLCY